MLVHRCALPVLVARERPLDAGVVAATRALPADRAALTAGAHIAARLGAELTVVHVPERDDEQAPSRSCEAELANARALLGRAARLPRVRRACGARDRRRRRRRRRRPRRRRQRGQAGAPALRSVSERVAHLAPCSVLVMRGR